MTNRKSVFCWSHELFNLESFDELLSLKYETVKN